MTIYTAPEVLAAAMGDEGVLDITKASSAQVPSLDILKYISMHNCSCM